MSGIHFGIDFGNTNTSVVQLTTDAKGTKYTVLADSVPSLLAIRRNDSGDVLFGRQVKFRRQQLTEEYEIISSFKSLLGTGATKRIDGKEISAIELTARLLHELKDHIRQQTGMDIDNATFSIPVDFTSRQRRELREAAGIAGITVNSFVSESTAAYVGCLDDIRHYSKVAVFDWGGGTLDISVLEKVGTELKELAKRGQNLGGDDIDRILANKIHVGLAEKHGFGSFDSMPARDRDYLLERCEIAKIELSEEDLTRLNLVSYGGVSSNKSLSINEFRDLIRPEVKRAAQLLEETLNLAGCYAQLDAILMVGGSSNIRAIRQLFEMSFEPRNIHVVYSEKDVQVAAAKGAAWLDSVPSAYRLQQTIGVLMSDQVIHPLLDVGETVPCDSGEVRFSLIEESTSANIIIVDKNGRRLCVDTLPVKGFLTEAINIRATVDEDLNAVIQMYSTHRPEDVRRQVLPSIELSYDLEVKPEIKPMNFVRSKRDNICSYRDCNGMVYRDGYCRYHFRYEKAASK